MEIYGFHVKCGHRSAQLHLFSCSLLSSDLVASLAVPEGCDHTVGAHPCLAQIFNTKSRLPELLLPSQAGVRSLG